MACRKNPSTASGPPSLIRDGFHDLLTATLTTFDQRPATGGLRHKPFAFLPFLCYSIFARMVVFYHLYM